MVEDDANVRKEMKVPSSRVLAASDVLTLGAGRWISGEIIKNFARHIFGFCNHKSDLRCVYIDTGVMQLMEVERYSPVRQVFNSLHMHDVDILVWPINTVGNHWCLAVGDTTTLEVDYIDPYRPFKTKPGSKETCKLVLKGLDIMCEEYSARFCDQRKWSYSSGGCTTKSLNLWK